MLLFGVSLTYPWNVKLEKQNFKHLLKISSFVLLKPLLQKYYRFWGAFCSWKRPLQPRVVLASLSAYDTCLRIHKRESSSVGPYSGVFQSVSATKGILLQRKNSKIGLLCPPKININPQGQHLCKKAGTSTVVGGVSWSDIGDFSIIFRQGQTTTEPGKTICK